MSSPSNSPDKKLCEEDVPIGVVEFNDEGCCTGVNSAACNIVGYSQSEIIGDSINKLNPDLFEDVYKNYTYEINSERLSGERTYLYHKNGKEIDVVVTTKLREGGGYKIFIQKLAQEDEQDGLSYYHRDVIKNLIENFEEPFYLVDQQRVVASNEANAELFGLSSESLEGKSEQQVASDVERYSKRCKKHENVFETGEPLSFTEELVDDQGEERVLETTCVPVKSSEKLVLGYSHEITSHTNRIRELSEQRKDMNVLNQVLRHDVRNRLQIILTHGDLITNMIDTNESQHAQRLLEAAREAVDITKTARDVSQAMIQSDDEYQPLILSDILQKEINEIRPKYESININISEPIPNIKLKADDMLPSVFRNLLINAVQHNDKEETKIDVSIDSGEDCVGIQIADNGPGVPDGKKEEIFEQGEKGLKSEGSGLGLYLADKLVSSYGGSIRVEDNNPCGSIFIIKLPVID